MIIRIITDVFLCAALFLLFTGTYRMILSDSVYDKLQCFDIITRGSGITALIGFCIWSFANARGMLGVFSIIMIIFIFIVIPLFKREICRKLILENKPSTKGGV